MTAPTNTSVTSVSHSDTSRRPASLPLLFDAKGKRIGKKKKTSVKSCNLNPYWNESFVFIIEEMEMKRVTLDITVCDYDLIGGGDPIGKIKLGWSQNKEYKPGFKHWKEALEIQEDQSSNVTYSRIQNQ